MTTVTIQPLLPTNNPVPTGITVTQNQNGSVDILLSWTYTQSATVPADGLMLFYKTGSTSTVTKSDASITLPVGATSYLFSGVAQEITGRIGIAAYRKTATGVSIGPIQQPTTTPDWRITGSTSDVANTVSETTTFRTTGAPTNSPVIGTLTTSSSAVGTVDVTVNWSYTQGALPAEEFVLYALEGTTNPTTSAAHVICAGTARSYTWKGVPADKSYKIGITARRKAFDGEHETAIVNAWTRTGATPNISAISIAGGMIQGIGTGNGTPVDNSLVTLSSLGAASTSDLATKLSNNSANILSGSVALKTSNYDSGTGFAIVSTGIIGKNGGVTTFTLDNYGNVTFKGDLTGSTGTFHGSISGSGGITITGQATFNGSTSDGTNVWSLIANNLGNTARGIYAAGTTTGVQGYGGSSGQGIYGTSFGGYGGYFTSVVGTGVYAASGAGYALDVAGLMRINNSTLVTYLNADQVDGHHASDFVTQSGATIYLGGITTGSATATFSSANKPGTSTTNTWALININGTNYRIPVWPD